MLCQPATLILLVAIAGTLFHLFVVPQQQVSGALWWITVGVFGTATFQLLCSVGLGMFAWILMLIPVAVLCFFFAVALFASSVRIRNEVAYDRSCDRSSCDIPECDQSACGCPT